MVYINKYIIKVYCSYICEVNSDMKNKINFKHILLILLLVIIFFFVVDKIVVHEFMKNSIVRQ
ncbi:hypothetical protein B0H39_004144 [Clostridium beijerinckii]|nr:hypothetical protein [Clostridium beijerinckii]NOV69920.1 hypothetical protein [Clostridium beijerinckii]NOW31173.1 hypothetical protein [Clostridium beijerinckii]NOW86263.1 hypothetical protein [Clostridium beijerinckii]